jgi:hypothetical protein
MVNSYNDGRRKNEGRSHAWALQLIVADNPLA